MGLLQMPEPQAPGKNFQTSSQAESAPQLSTPSRKISSVLAALKECSTTRDLRAGKLLHASAVDEGVDSNTYVANSLVNMYSKCGSLADARLVFDRMIQHTVVSWNSLILAYVDNGEARLGLELFEKMVVAATGNQCEPNALTFVAALQACAAMAAVEHGREVGDKIIKLASLERGMAVYAVAAKCRCDTDILVATTLISVCAKCGSVDDARQIFDAMPHHSVVSWNAMLLGCAENGRAKLALDLFASMQAQSGGGVRSNSRTFVAAFKACTALAIDEQAQEVNDRSSKKLVKIKSLEKSMAIHALAARSGSCDLRANLFVASGLIDMYAKCGSIDLARRVFDRFERHDVVSWTALLLGYAENGEEEAALELFFSGVLGSGGLQPNALSFVAAVKACSGVAEREDRPPTIAVKPRSLEIGMTIHARLASSPSIASDLFLASSLVDMYAKCGSAADAARVFAGMEQPDTVAWNALILGYADNGHDELALEALATMRLQQRDHGCRPDARTYAAALKACGNLVALQECRRIHAAVIRGGRQERDHVLANCLVDVYGKCGSMADAQRVFDGGAAAGVVTWNALLAGYGRQGDTDAAFRVFRSMSDEGRPADSVTLTALLAACSHAGQVARARRVFEAMEARYGVIPEIGHYHTVIDMLGRANQLHDAVETIRAMPYEPSGVTWMIVLNACWKWKNVSVGRLAFESLLASPGGAGADAAAAYVLMSNIYETQSPIPGEIPESRAPAT